MRHNGQEYLFPTIPIRWGDGLSSRWRQERLQYLDESARTIENLLEEETVVATEIAVTAIAVLHREASSLLGVMLNDTDREPILRMLFVTTALDPTLLDETHRILETVDTKEALPPWVWQTMYTLRSLHLEFIGMKADKEAWIRSLMEQPDDAA